jgi:hypothetical protein
MAGGNDEIEATTLSYDGTHFVVPRSRWMHILDRHPELVDAMATLLPAASTPDEIFIDPRGALHILKALIEGQSDYLVLITRKKNSKTYLVTTFYMNSKKKERRYKKFKKLALF